MKIRLSNGNEYDILCVNGFKQYFQGAERDVLDIQFEKNKYSFEELEKCFLNENSTNKIYIIDAEQNEYLHENYSLRIKISLINTLNNLSADNQSNIDERISIQMAQKTYQEIMLSEIRQTVDMLVLESLKGGEM